MSNGVQIPISIPVGNTGGIAALQQTAQTINQVTAAQQKQAQVNQLIATQQKQAQASQASAAAVPRATGAVKGAAVDAASGAGAEFSGAVLGALGVQTSIGGAAAAMLGFVHILTESAGQTRDFAEQLNVTTEEFQRMQIAASDTGTPLRRMIENQGVLEQQRRAAAEGNAKARDAFAELGISLDDLNNESIRAVDLQNKLGAATANMTDKQRAAVRELLGAQGARLLPALAAMEAIQKQSLASDEGLARVDAYGKFWERTWQNFKAAGIDAFASVNEGAEKFWRKMMGDNTDDTGPNLRKDRQEFEKQIDEAGGDERRLRGGASRYLAFEDYGNAQADAANAAEAARRKAQDDADTAALEAFNLAQQLPANDEAPTTPEQIRIAAEVKAAEARQAAFLGERERQERLRDAARANSSVGYQDFARDRPDLNPPAGAQTAPMFHDLAVAKEIAELDKLRTENAEKRRKLEFDMLAPAQQRADIERRMREEQEIIEGDPDAKRVEEAKGRQNDLQGELAGLLAKGGTFNAPVDSLQKAGGFLGGSDTDMRDSARDAAREAAATRRAIEGLPQKIAQATAATVTRTRIVQ